MTTCTRRLSFDYAHRLLNHESKCANLHGHRGEIEIECWATSLDRAGRVIDFSSVKQLVGRKVDLLLDHAMIVNPNDESMIKWLDDNRQRHFVMPPDLAEPSAENIANLILQWSRDLLPDVRVVRVRLYETPNGWADAK